MIVIRGLTDADKGRWVEFTKYYGDDAKDLGRIKSWNSNNVFVVFHCDGYWENYTDYTAEAVDPSRIEFVMKEKNNDW